MDQTISTWHARVVVAVLVVILLVVGVGMGSVAVNGFLWNMEEIDDVQISSEENQTVSEIKVYNEDKPVRVDVGDLVDAGAEFDNNESAYDINNGQQSESGEVFIKDSKTTNATIVINSSALDNLNAFDLVISNIDTTGVSTYTKNLSESNNEIRYVAEQDGERDYATFNVESQANVSIASDSYNAETKKIKLKSLELTDNSTDHVVVWERSEKGDIKRKLGSVQGYKKSIRINESSIEGETEIAVAVHPENEEIQTKTIHAVDNSTITSPISIELIRDPVYYNNRSVQVENETSTILFEFNTNVDTHQGNISIDFLNRSKSTVEIGEDTDKYIISGRYLRVFPYENKSTNKMADINNISIENISADVESNSLSQGDYNAHRIEKSPSNSDEQTISQGTNFGIISNSSKNISLVSNNLGVEYDITNKSSNIHILNTTDVQVGNYTIISDGENNGTQLEIINTSLSAEIPVAATFDDFSVNISPIKTDRHLVTKLYNKSGATRVVSEDRIRKGQKGKITMNIPNKEEYELHIRDLDTGDTKTQSVQILQNKSTELRLLPDSDTIGISNIIQIRLNSTYTDTSVKLVNSHNNSTTATINLSTPEKGNTSIGFNTYAAGNTSLTDAIVTTDNTVTVDSIETSTPNGTLPPGDYELSVQSEHGDAKTETNTTFTLQNRSTNGVTPYTTNEKDPTDLGTTETIRSAIANETLSPSSTISTNQTVVYAVNASGLTGLPAVKNVTLETGADLREFSGYSFGVQPSTSAELTTVDTTDTVGNVPDDSTVHIDDSRLYVVANGDDALGTDDPSDGEEYTATFRVDDDHLRTTATDPSADHTVTTTLTVADLDDQQGSNAVDGGDSDGHDDSTAGTTPVDNGHNDGSSAGGGPTGGGSTGGGPADADAERNTGSSATNPTDSAISGVTDADEPGVPDGEYGAAVRQLPSLHTPHPTVPATIRFSSGADENLPDTSERATAASTGQEQLSDTPEQTDEFREPDAPGYDEAPIRSTAYDIPGFGPIVTLVSLLAASYVAARRQ